MSRIFGELKKAKPKLYDTYLDIEELLGQYWRTLINWLTRTIEHSSKHFNTHGHSEDITSELTGGAHVINTGGTFEDLCEEIGG